MRWIALCFAVAGCVVNVSGNDPTTGNDGSDGGKPSSDPKTASFSFHPNREASTGAIDVTNAYELVTLCDLTYLDPSQIPAALRALGVDPVAGHYKAFANASTETFAYYVEADGAAFIVFRGTEKNWQNIAQDADLFPSDEIIGEVDDGFQVATDGVWSDVHDYITSRQPGLPLYITGHSMGAAIATIATARALLGDSPLDVVALYAFASPRVGEGTFSNELATAMQDAGVFYGRVVNDCDPVTNVPERVGPDLIPFYEHVSWGTNENDFVDWIQKGKTTLARSIPFNACPLAGLDYNFAEHMSPAYMAALAPLR
jgi:triacylglycerol lipase